MHTLELTLAATIALSLIGCDGGGPSGAVSCITTIDVSGAPLGTCTEYTGLTGDQLDAIRSSCSATDAGAAIATYAFDERSCDTTGSAGGCRIESGGFVATTWYLEGYTEATVRSSCTMVGGATFVAP